MTLNETYQQINEYGKNFHDIWQNTLKPEFLKHENLRKQELAKFRSLMYLYVVLFIFCIIGVFNAFTYDKLFVPILTIISAILLWQICTLPKKADKKFTSLIKSQYIDCVMNAFAGIKRVPPDNEINEWLLTKSELFAEFYFKEVDDAFTGVHKNVDYTISEIKLFDYFHKHLKKETKMKVFQGVVISFSSNKKIKNKTMVSTRGDFKIKGLPICAIISLVIYMGYKIYMGESIIYWLIISGIFILILTTQINGSKLFASSSLNNNNFTERLGACFENTKEIKLEDPRFMKRYKAFSSDEVEGRYLLTTAFMERFNNVRTAFGTNNLKCSFVDDKFVIAISAKNDLFELCSLFTPMDNSKYLSKFYNQIVAVLLLSDYFRLDEKTGL